MKLPVAMFSMFVLIASLVLACGKPEEATPAPEPPAPAEVYQVKVSPGRNRVRLSWLLDAGPKVTKVRVYWNNQADSVEVPRRKQKGIDTMSVLLPGLKEGNYTFRFSTAGNTGKAVFKVNTTGAVYGDNYQKSLQNRGIKSVTQSKGTAVVDWLAAAREVIGLEVHYADATGAARRVLVPAVQNSVLLPAFKHGTVFSYRTWFLPEPSAIDTFYAAPATSQQAPHYGSLLTKKIAENSSLVGKVLRDTLLELQAGIEQTNLQYQGQDGRLIALYLLAVDLNNTKVGIRAGLPFNKPDFTRQVVSEIARYADAPQARVVAAVNGDFFINSVPQSVVVKNGVAIKPTAREDAAYFAIYKNGSPVIGTIERFRRDQPDIQEAIGGYHWLVRDGVKVPQGDPSVEPRTIVGYTSNKIVYFVVIDGRQAQHSTGMSFAQLAELMKALEVRDGLNLDGGGSSTLVARLPGTDTWQVQNKPSDGTQRAVANGLVVVALP